MTTTAAVGLSELAARTYADEAGMLPAIAAILVLPAEGRLTIWSVLDGDSDGETRRTLYDLELAVWDRHPEADISFHVLDLAEYPSGTREALLPSGAHVLYQRPAQEARTGQ